MKNLVPVLRILITLGLFKSMNWLLDAYPSPSPLSLAALLAMFVLFGAAWLLVGYFEPHTMVPCPHCGERNIPERRICKHCRESLPLEKPQPQESQPLIQHWIDVEVAEAERVRD